LEQAYELDIPPGAGFRIGSTLFRFEAPEALMNIEPDDPPEEMDRTSIDQKIYSVAELRATEFGHATDRMDVFSQLPKLISKSRNDAEFASQLVALLLPTIPLGQAAAVIRCRHLSDPDDLEFDLVRSVLRDASKEFRPSRRLVHPALVEGTSRVHMWNKPPGSKTVYADADSDSDGEDATNSLNLEWAICVPVPDKRRREWCLYISGRFSQDGHFLESLEDLKPDVRYIELLAQFVGATREVRLLQQQQGLLGHFFSPNVVDWLNESHDPEVLTPRHCDITALVCDLRGFSRRVEIGGARKLQQLLGDVSEALGVMTRGIFHHDGVVGDYQGDSALGFWGWPIDSSNGPLPACLAALMIQEEFRKARTQGTGPLADLRMGIGIAHGPALAGKIGTEQHAKVGAFGPVVERGSRLESLTKTFRAAILLDEATADFAREHLSPDDGRIRRLGRVQLPGTNSPMLVSELLPAVRQDASLTDDNIEEYEAAVDALTAGDWSAAIKLLDRLPPDDRAKDFLMIFIALNDYEPPANWAGVISLPAF
jgi:adenylate cyclase